MNKRDSEDWSHRTVEGYDSKFLGLTVAPGVIDTMPHFLIVQVGFLVFAGFEWLFRNPTRRDWEQLGILYGIACFWTLLYGYFEGLEKRLKRIEHKLIAIHDKLGTAREDV